MMKSERTNVVYAMITTNCNLTCNYCTIRDSYDGYNRDAFIRQLIDFDGKIILFGGEPTLYRDRLLDVFYHDGIRNKVKSITTNLMILDDDIIELLKNIKSVGTSWNPSRFRNGEYDIWKNNLNKLEDHGITVGILATLTEELINMSPSDVLDIINTWNPNVVKNINFELCISDHSTPEYFKKCDEWLCEIYKSWNCKFVFRNADTIKNWYHDCNYIYTLTPTGKIIHRCPQGGSMKIPSECYSCNRNDICRPCRLQSHCSYMHKFGQLVKKIYDMHHDSIWLNKNN